MNEIDEGIAQTSNQGQAAILVTVGDWEREAGGAACLLMSEEGESTPRVWRFPASVCVCINVKVVCSRLAEKTH